MRNKRKYSYEMRVFHWIMAVIIIGMASLGLYMTRLSDKNPIKFELYDWHMAFGVLILFLIVIRGFIRARTEVPALPPTISPWEHKAAKIAHALLYVCMVGVPTFGYLASSAYPPDIGIWFFGMTVPDGIAKDKELAEILIEFHRYFAYSFIALIVLHVGAALKLRYFDDAKNDVLSRML